MGNANRHLRDFLDLPVSTNLRSRPPTVLPIDSISAAMNLMIRENVGAVVVIEDDRPIGIVTERDILERVIKRGKDFDRTLVKDTMSSPLVTVDADQPIRDALNAMREHDIRRLVVVKNGSLLGVTTERRLLEIAHAQHSMRRYDATRGLLYDDAIMVRVAYVSTYPPRECGIAMYTKDLVDAVSRIGAVKFPAVIAINDRGSYYDYENVVEFQIDQDDVDSYEKAADYINSSDIDVVSLQHEYGLFDGVWGEHVITLLEKIKKPVVATLHTVLEEPPSDAREVMEKIVRRGDFVVVMARIGMRILEEFYGTLADRVRYIPHGCPNLPHIGTDVVKSSLGLEGRVVLSTFGLLSRGKGVEYAIEAMPQLAAENQQIVYLIIGETHPEVRKREGEKYRESLLNLVHSLGLGDNIKFVNRFLPQSDLIRYLQATDIYIIPYPNREQISSGTLSYALSTGKAIVTTPFLHAEEVISEGAAIDCEFKSPHSIGERVVTLLKDNEIRKRLENRAYEYSRAMIWPNVGMKYLNLFYSALGLRSL